MDLFVLFWVALLFFPPPPSHSLFSKHSFRKRLSVRSHVTTQGTSASVASTQNNFGDIMGTAGCYTNVNVDGTFTPMERVVLTANGNLQRIMSAYYGSTVYVQVKHCEKVSDEIMLYEREADILVGDKVFCNAKGRIEIFDAICQDLVESKVIGVGQLFRFLNILPSFQLYSAGKYEDGRLWREYELSCPQLSCRFLETFDKDFLDLKEW